MKKINKQRMGASEQDLIYEEMELCYLISEEEHPAIANLLDMHETDEEFILIMELIEGTNMFKWVLSHLKDNDYSEKMGSSAFKQICEALQALHERGIAHRDIKLDNIIIYEDINSAAAAEELRWRVKLIDFGLSSVFL